MRIFRIILIGLALIMAERISAMPYTDSSTAYNSTVMKRYEPELLEVAAKQQVASRFAVTKHEMKGDNEVQFSKILRPSKQTSALVEGTMYDIDDAKQLVDNKITVTRSKWGDTFAFTDDVDFASFISDKQNREVIAAQFSESMEFQVIKTMVLGGMWHRLDFDTDYEVTAFPDAGGSTTSLIDADALNGQADDFWINANCTIYHPSGPNYDVSRQVTDSAQSSGALTLNAFNHAITTASAYKVTQLEGLGASDVISTAALVRVMSMHRKLKTVPFQGGIMRAFIDAEQEMDLWSDSSFLNSAIYDNSKRFQSYKLGRWFNIEFAINDDNYLLTTSGAYSSSGTVHPAPIFGRDSYAVLHWGNAGINRNKFGVDWVIVDTPDSSNTRNTMHFISWKGHCAMVVLRATSIINLMTGVSASASGGLVF